MTIPIAQYKSMYKSLLPIAKARGDTNKYSEIEYSNEEGAIRIKAKRYSKVKAATTPYSLLLLKNQSGEWKIREEKTDSYVLPQSTSGTDQK